MSGSSVPMLIPRSMLNSDISELLDNISMSRNRLIIIRRRRDPLISHQDGLIVDSTVSEPVDSTVSEPESSNFTTGSSSSAGTLQLLFSQSSRVIINFPFLNNLNHRNILAFFKFSIFYIIISVLLIKQFFDCSYNYVCNVHLFYYDTFASRNCSHIFLSFNLTKNQNYYIKIPKKKFTNFDKMRRELK